MALVSFVVVICIENNIVHLYDLVYDYTLRELTIISDQYHGVRSDFLSDCITLKCVGKLNCHVDT